MKHTAARPRAALLHVTATLLAMFALPQSFAQGTAEVPTDLSYKSSFAHYLGWDHATPTDWRRLNNQALQLGGHLGQLRAANAMSPDARGTGSLSTTHSAPSTHQHAPTKTHGAHHEPH